MTSHRLISTLGLLVSFAIPTSWPLIAMAQPNDPSQLEALLHTYRDGNYAEAYDGLRRIVLSNDALSADLPKALDVAINCLQQLGRTNEIDAFREQAVSTHENDWRLLTAVARSYVHVDHHGSLIAAEFHRGPHRGGGRAVHATSRDRVRALQLFRQAMKLAESADDKNDAAAMLHEFAAAVVYQGAPNQAWRLQTLTDLDELPDYEEGWGHYLDGRRGAPVDEDGNPVYYDLPRSWNDAQNDGERWRWVLETMVEWQPARRIAEQLARANFLHGQFGVQTMAEYRVLLARSLDDGSTDHAATWALDTLGEEETIARLATGIKRFRLPDEHNFIKLYQSVADAEPPADKQAEALPAIHQLASIFENRRQYPRASEYWQQMIEHEGNPERKKHAQDRLQQIVGNWGQFEGAISQPAGRGASVEFRFRNARRVEFVACEINIRKLLDDVKAYLASNPRQLDWQKMNVSEVGHRLVQKNQEQYVGAEVARWHLDLEARANHFDRRISVATPLQKAGAYLVTANVADGNSSKVVLWLADTALVRKPIGDQSLYYVADAVTGRPIAGAKVDFVGYRQVHLDGARYRVDTKEVTERTDSDGQAFLSQPGEDADPAGRGFQWLAIATTQDGRLGYLGFHNVWRARYDDAQHTAVKTFTATDRPVYRPGQPVEFKFWIRQPQYDRDGVSPDDRSRFAHQSFVVEIHNPRGEKIYVETLTSDNYGGLAGKFELPEDAALGQYQLLVVGRGGGTFRVEEYKKPEFQVIIEAPDEPVALGERIKATIRADYYFGAPVANATVKYKVLRSEHTSRWFPPGPWDWLYGPAYGWTAPEYDWYPGWRSWGCPPPLPGWNIHRPAPPEIVVEREVPIGPDGRVEVEIDTAIAQAAHPDHDHRYEIQAEVADGSRRTIVGRGELLVARKPFDVRVWVTRGYYRVDDTIQVSATARRLDGKPVAGAGKLRLLKISYGDAPERKLIETEVRAWDLATNAQGQAELQIKASEEGQYRLSYTVTGAAGRQIEGGYIFTIIGEGFDGNEFQFNDLEIIPQRPHYAPGERVEMQINTNRVGSTVLLFARPARGVYLPPQVIRLPGKSTTVELAVTEQDMPNFFVEAVTIAGGKVHTELREIHVPPAKRIINVEVAPSADAYQPGQRAKIKLKLTDETGEPFVGSTALTIYDKSVEYISGGSNVADIKKFYWDWRRQHRPYQENNLQRWSGNLVPPSQKRMELIGIFGSTVADDDEFLLEMVKASTFGGAVPSRSRAGAVPETPPPAAPAFADPAVDLFVSFDEAAPATPFVEPTVRSEFADTALWVPSLETGKDGLAEVELPMPENLTTWKIRAWSMGRGTRVGEATTEVVTRKNLLVRMQAPRFFIETDEVVLSANVHNYFTSGKVVTVRLEQDGDTLELPDATEKTIEIPAGGERRIDWRVKVVREGEATLRMLALSDSESDAVQMSLPVYVHGMLKMESFTGALRAEDHVATFEVTVPSKRRAEQTRLEVRYSPTLADAMVDALPYLVDYPYGCTEQTLNRFLPAVITQQTLLRMGLDLKTIHEKRTNLNVQAIGDPAARAAAWQRFDRNPVFDEAELTKIVNAGVTRLAEMQLADGGWGWFSGWDERSTPHMTALVVHGLQIAQANDIAVPTGMIERGIGWLKLYQAEQLRLIANVDDAGNVKDRSKPGKHAADNLDALVYMVLADADVMSNEMRDYLYRDRTKLAVYGLSLYGLALHKQHETDKLAMVMRNIGQYLVEEVENQTAYLNLPADIWWRWYGSEYEAHAYYVKLLAAAEPDNPLASRLVKYLVNNRKHATYWNSTRDTAIVIEALADYIKATGEDEPDLSVEVWVNGQKRQEAKINAGNLFAFEGALVIEGEALEAGRHTIELRKAGTGPLYWNGYLTNFTLEDDIRSAGLELKVERRYYRLTPAEKQIDVAGGRGQIIGQPVEKYDRIEIPNLGSVESGDLLEIELVVHSKNDYEYIILEDLKAAGCEPVALQSGYDGNELGAYVELRDNRVALFVHRLARGTHSVSYRMRAEIPGRFSALPTRAYAMYAPEFRSNSDELKLEIENDPPATEQVTAAPSGGHENP